MSDLSHPPTSKEAIAIRLRMTRLALGFDQQNLFAQTAGAAVSTYNNYEKAERIPNLDHAIRLCERFELTLDWLYRGDPSGLSYALANKINKIRSDLYPGTH